MCNQWPTGRMRPARLFREAITLWCSLHQSKGNFHTLCTAILRLICSQTMTWKEPLMKTIWWTFIKTMLGGSIRILSTMPWKPFHFLEAHIATSNFSLKWNIANESKEANYRTNIWNVNFELLVVLWKQIYIPKVCKDLQQQKSH